MSYVISTAKEGKVDSCETHTAGDASLVTNRVRRLYLLLDAPASVFRVVTYRLMKTVAPTMHDTDTIFYNT
jgi:hypothetical protein